jgi:Zn-dependent M16 (insulinase) family peptidase
METWMISLTIAAGGIISSFAVVKYMADELKRNQESIFKRLDSHGDDLVALNTMSKLAMTAKDVDDKYVSKELFRQFEKHIDKRFDSLEAGQGKILSYIEKVNTKG